MDVLAEIQRAWADHGDHPAAVLERRPALADAASTPEQVVRLSGFLVHFVGEERADWAEVAALLAHAMVGVPEGPDLAPALTDLYVARLLSGQTAAALEAQTRLLAHGGAAPVAHLARGALLYGVSARKADPDATALLEAALDLADSFTAPTPADRGVAVLLNNFASDLLTRQRHTDTDRLLRRAAKTSLTFWKRAGTWVNEERALYLNALAHRHLAEAGDALAAARAGLAVIAAHGAEPVDPAFLPLVEAAALRDMDPPEHEAARAAADTLAAAFDDEGLRSWYADERAKAFA